MDLSETDKAYIAGLVDGEGSFMVRVQWQNQQRWGSGMAIRPVMSVGQGESRIHILRWLQSKLGGRVDRIYGDEHTTNWVLEGKKNLCVVIPLIKPYMKIKNIVADIVLGVCNTKFSSGEFDPIKWLDVLEKVESVYRINSHFRPERLQKSLERLQTYRSYILEKCETI